MDELGGTCLYNGANGVAILRGSHPFAEVQYLLFFRFYSDILILPAY